MASIPSGHWAGQAFEAFFFLHAHLMVWCWGSLGGTRDRGQQLWGCVPWLWHRLCLRGQGRTRGCRGCPAPLAPTPTAQGCKSCPAPPEPPCNPLLGSQFREFALIQIQNVFLYVTSPPGSFSPLDSSLKPSWRKRHCQGGFWGCSGPSPPWCFHPSPVSFPRAPLSSQGKAGQLGKAHFSNVCSTAR